MVEGINIGALARVEKAQIRNELVYDTHNKIIVTAKSEIDDIEKATGLLLNHWKSAANALMALAKISTNNRLKLEAVSKIR